MKSTRMIDVLCASPASTAICMSVEDRQRSMVRQGRTRAVERKMLLDRQGSRASEPKGVRTRGHYHHSRTGFPDQHEQYYSATMISKSQESSAISSNEVVVMRVSLHCQGCAGKVRRHISKMEGVTSFSIDLEKQKVTVAGNVSPSGVLESISKVKRAEFWPAATSNNVI
uniref:HMA domain-containing protein n=1 Tax=Picea sitchensis TaxID=3332 RepID=A9NT93_PICSI|nr:unknown [Picea sitchensis]